MGVPVTLERLQQYATSKGGACLATTYLGYQAKHAWRCHKGHEWLGTAYGALSKNRWCPHCYGNARGSVDNLRKLANDKGGECLSDTYTNNRALYKWKCANGHIWEARGVSIVNGFWCPDCAGNKAWTLEELNALAKDKGGSVVSLKGKYGTAVCTKGHTWKLNVNNFVVKGSWCPKCVHRVSKEETEVFEYVKSHCPDAIGSVRGLLKQRNMELDVYVPSLRKAVEFDGTYWHGSDDAKARDRKKDSLCSEVGIVLLRVPQSLYRNNRPLALSTISDFLRSP